MLSCILLLKSTKPNQLFPDKRGNLAQLAVEEKKLWIMEQYFICDFIFSILAIALAEFCPALLEPARLRRSTEWLTQLLSRANALKPRCAAKIKSNACRMADYLLLWSRKDCLHRNKEELSSKCGNGVPRKEGDDGRWQFFRGSY